MSAEPAGNGLFSQHSTKEVFELVRLARWSETTSGLTGLEQSSMSTLRQEKIGTSDWSCPGNTYMSPKASTLQVLFECSAINLELIFRRATECRSAAPAIDNLPNIPDASHITVPSARTRPIQGIHGCMWCSVLVLKSGWLEHLSRRRRRDSL